MRLIDHFNEAALSHPCHILPTPWADDYAAASKIIRMVWWCDESDDVLYLCDAIDYLKLSSLTAEPPLRQLLETVALDGGEVDAGRAVATLQQLYINYKFARALAPAHLSSEGYWIVPAVASTVFSDSQTRDIEGQPITPWAVDADRARRHGHASWGERYRQALDLLSNSPDALSAELQRAVTVSHEDTQREGAGTPCLTLAQRRSLAAAYLAVDPSMSDRRIGEMVGLDHKAIARIRSDIETGASAQPTAD